ncbi:glycoside hydrolase family 5 protein [Cylindrobasidium torrendii FP15055 ss-10]|uniref:Glycoside hydrolase family 5 protein n=1 Tax=Cylindrobasidium torrendii FP15055 ss-10 TaxID=1314674 RepID=A0A0D7BRT5_9AGAR|nr:glycoside hydrolase family 5 protein [Cylindrobasidium torrendii FP15055 ss-10]
MDRFMNKVKGKIQKTMDQIERELTGGDSAVVPSGGPPIPLDLNNPATFFRYRKQRGVNLGSWFVLERWISEAPFREAKAPGQSDLDVAKGSNAKSILEQHWDTWITEPDWQFLAEKGVNTVRLPIGYYHLCGAERGVLERTHFEDHYDVFSGAWPRIVAALETAQRYGMGVLLDLHAAPGKQNHDSHGGTSKDPEFFHKSRHRDHTITVLLTLIRLLGNRYPHIVGIELLNEPAPPSDGDLKSWYSEAIRAISAVDPTIPLYLGECWQTENYAGWMKSIQPGVPNMLVLDHHLYRCFTGEDTQTPADDHAGRLRDPNNATPQLFGRVGSSMVIGEWSAALNPGSIKYDNDKEHRVFANAQYELYERTCAGFFFWTYKKGEGWDNGWSFRDVQRSEVLPSWIGGMRGRIPPDGSDAQRRDAAGHAATGQLINRQASHSGYWSTQSGNYNFARFGEGFFMGWNDSYAFFRSVPIGAPVPEIGFRAEWARRRSGDGYWEFEHGFNQGADAARHDYASNYC